MGVGEGPYMGVEPKIGGFCPQNGWFVYVYFMENLMNMDDLGGKKPLFLETSIYTPEFTN